MKLIFLLYFVVCLKANGQLFLQIKPDTSEISPLDKYLSEPKFSAYFLDSILLNKGYLLLDTNNIKEIMFLKNGQTELPIGNRIGISFSRKVKTPLLRLSDIKITLANPDSLPIDYVIADTYISDTSNIFMESTAIKKINILKYTNDPQFIHDRNSIVVFINPIPLSKKKKNSRKHQG